jgi:hypothetical protein
VSIHYNEGKEMKAFLLIIGMWWFTEWAYATELKVQVKGDSASIAKIMAIVPGVEKVISSPEFKARVLASKFTSTIDSPAKIVEKISIPVWDLHYEFKMQKNWLGRCPVLGWTYPGTKTVWFNSCNFKGRDDAGIAGTICHEQMHKLGYGHKSAKDIMSVPYSIGNICAELYGKTK